MYTQDRDPEQVRAVLLVEDTQGKRLVNLDKNIYSLGRGANNSIVLHCLLVSRYHATLVRLYNIETKSYYFYIMDGDFQGNHSTNGLAINGKTCQQQILQHKDCISFGGQVKARYLVVEHDKSEAEIFAQGETGDFLDKETVSPDAFQTLSENFVAPTLSESALLRLASFPELLPSPIIEIDLSGIITYLNPAALLNFPDIKQAKYRHPIVEGLIDAVQQKKKELFVREIKVDKAIYEQSVYYIAESRLIRSYLVDITQRQRKEAELRKYKEQLEELVAERTASLVKVLEQLQQEISDRQIAEAALQQNQEFLRNVIDTVPNLIFVKDIDGKFTLVNQAVAYMYGTTVEDLVGKTDADFNAERAEIEYYNQCDLQVITTKQPAFIPEETVSYPTAVVRWFQTIKKPLVSVDGKTPYVLAVATDITERKQVEEQLKASLEEKEVLLKEIHHRVKNNLQVISSLLRLQSRYTQEPHALDMLKESQNRVKSMALIHEQLYQSRDLARIDFADYIQSLTKNLLYSYSIDLNAIQLEFQSENVYLNLDTAIPCGLFVNELVSNALKHGFPDGRQGKITISFSQIENEQFLLTVKDNGIGFPSDLDFHKTETLGLRLVGSLASQLQGTLEMERSDGTLFKLKFSELKYKHRV